MQIIVQFSSCKYTWPGFNKIAKKTNRLVRIPGGTSIKKCSCLRKLVWIAMLKDDIDITYTTARLCKYVTRILLQGYGNVIKNKIRIINFQ